MEKLTTVQYFALCEYFGRRPHPKEIKECLNLINKPTWLRISRTPKIMLSALVFDNIEKVKQFIEKHSWESTHLDSSYLVEFCLDQGYFVNNDVFEGDVNVSFYIIRTMEKYEEFKFPKQVDILLNQLKNTSYVYNYRNRVCPIAKILYRHNIRKIEISPNVGRELIHILKKINSYLNQMN